MSEKFTLKALYNQAFVQELANAIATVSKGFDTSDFEQRIFDTDWNECELKQRMRHITQVMQVTIPGDYRAQIKVLYKVAPKIKDGLLGLIFPDFVEQYGLEDYATSVKALAHFTPYSSSEFAVRPFIERYPKMMHQMLAWTDHPNEHIRRLASEGCRPRLPWGMALKAFKKDPAPILPILEKLKADSALYVRKSVANNLNDIIKDNPEIALDTAERWLKTEHPHTQWIVKHGVRTLLKRGDKRALALFGLADATGLEISDLSFTKNTLTIGEHFHFSFQLQVDKPRVVRIEYGVYFVKSNGSQSRKVFQVSEKAFLAGKHAFTRKQNFHNLTTRKHYAGTHRLVIIVNGEEKLGLDFELTS